MVSLAIDRFLEALPHFEKKDFGKVLSLVYDDNDVEEAAPRLRAAVSEKVYEAAAALTQDAEFLNECVQHPQLMREVLPRMFHAIEHTRHKALKHEAEAFKKALNEVHPCPCGMRCNLDYRKEDKTIRCFCGKVVKRRVVDGGSPIVAVARGTKPGSRVVLPI